MGRRGAEKAHHQHAVVTSQNVFRAVAMVYVKVHNRHALKMTALQRMQGSNGNVVEKQNPMALLRVAW